MTIIVYNFFRETRRDRHMQAHRLRRTLLQIDNGHLHLLLLNKTNVLFDLNV